MCQRAYPCWLMGLLVGVACSQGASGAGLPVVFVPGTGGTRLVERRPEGDRRVWIAPSLLEDGDGGRDQRGVERMMLTPEGRDGPTKLVVDQTIRALNLHVTMELRAFDPDARRPEDAYTTKNLIDLKKFSVPVYGDFFDWAQRQWSDSGGFYDVPYDWRKGACEENDLAIDAKVNDALKDNPKAGQVVLVAHSLGGLVARHYLCQGRNAKKVRALIAVGTPWLGTPKTARALRYGFSFGLGGRVDPPDDYMAKGIYIYYFEGKEVHRVPYHTMVSLLDPAKTRKLAATLPCVFQQLPTDDYAVLFAKAMGRQEPVSVFLGESWKATVDSFIATNETLYNQAQIARKTMLSNDNHGVRHVLIAGTLDPDIAPELAMDMRMAEESNINYRLRWMRGEISSLSGLSLELAGSGQRTRAFFDAMKAEFASYKANRQIREGAMKELANQFFGLVPLFEDMGNYNWHYLRIRMLTDIREKKKLPIFHERYVPIDSDAKPFEANKPIPPRWGDGTAPLLSATAGYKDKLSPQYDTDPTEADKLFALKAPERLLGEGTTVFIVPLGKDKDGYPLEHSRMLDDSGIRKQLRDAYDAAGLAPNQ
jgi:pimeloyl-ACP methyl ester carboxylesterase